MSSNVVVVIGVGGMGRAIAHRQGIGNTLVLADFNEKALSSVADDLRGHGHRVVTHSVDVSSRTSVAGLAEVAAQTGRVTQVAHTAGLSPVQSPAEAILQVDLLGTALVLDAFGQVIADGGAGVAIASMAGHMLAPGALSPEHTQALAHTPADELLDLPFLAPQAMGPAGAYTVAKYANRLRVQAASTAWGARGARINSISPGVISTPMGQQELAGDSGQHMRAMIEASGTGRVGTADDIAAAAAFLLGPEATFITGNDLLVDGGVVAALDSGRLTEERGAEPTP